MKLTGNALAAVVGAGVVFLLGLAALFQPGRVKLIGLVLIVVAYLMVAAVGRRRS